MPSPNGRIKQSGDVHPPELDDEIMTAGGPEPDEGHDTLATMTAAADEQLRLDQERLNANPFLSPRSANIAGAGWLEGPYTARRDKSGFSGLLLLLAGALLLYRITR